MPVRWRRRRWSRERDVPTAEAIRILVVDDHPLIQEGIRAQFAQIAGFRLVGQASDAETALRLARQEEPDIVLMDIGLSGSDGLEATRQLGAQVPASRVIVLTMHDDQEYVVQAVRAGARGYVLKSAPPDELVAAIRAVAGGQLYYAGSVAEVVVREYVEQVTRASRPRLTARERQVLALVSGGHSNKEAAERLSLSVRTVETYRERIMKKLDLHSVADLTRYAMAEGLVSPR